MVRPFVFLTGLLIAPTSQAADPWLCIAEEAAYVAHTDTEVTHSGAGPVDYKFLITDEGLRLFGSEILLLDTCQRAEDRPATCTSSYETVVDNFRMNQDLVFVLYRAAYVEESDEAADYVVKGKCSKL